MTSIADWIRNLDSQRRTIFFSILARELTIIFRAYFAEDEIQDASKLKGLYSFNEIQHRILIRLLPTSLIDQDGADIILSEIQAQASRDSILASHILEALNSSRLKVLQDFK